MNEDSGSASWRCRAVWARAEPVDGNDTKQLVVPAAPLTVALENGQLIVRNTFGKWPASTPEKPLPKDELWARLPLGTRVDESAPRNTSWNTPEKLQTNTSDEVLESYKDAISFRESSPHSDGLRTPQIGALHATLGYWTTKRRTPATVVMPTGTGKTETMLALLVAARIRRLLVLVPSDFLRDQVSSKFETLGVLQELGIVAKTAIRPIVGRLEHVLQSADNARRFAERCNVVVATSSVLSHFEAEPLASFLQEFSNLFVDEAHHVAARTWSGVRDKFADKDVVQFTATPFREDGRHLQGRMIYSFPLREAQEQKYFSEINYTAVIDFVEIDRQVAIQAVAQLRADRASDFDHVLMARARSFERAQAIKAIYDDVGSEFKPVIINHRMGKRDQKKSLAALRSRESRIIVCVNMLGEGFDLPALKIAAVHDPQKSLAVTLQFIGRFARTSNNDEYGTASIYVARTEIELDRRLRTLYAEDSDWNRILRNLTEEAVEEQQEASDFEEGFTSLPEDVNLRSLLPKMSTVVYKTPTSNWAPDAILDFFGEEDVITVPIGLNIDAGVAWCVVKKRKDVRWGDLKTIEDVSYELYILYFDTARRLLYINNSANDGVFEELAQAVAGEAVLRFTGSTVYRVMADIDRLVPTNVGVIDAHDQFRRFSMHVGSDVTASFSQAEAGTKSQTNISGGGYRDGERVSISASLKGRIWSHAAARGIKHWKDWCDEIGTKLLDESISIDNVIGQFILPQHLEVEPVGVLLAVEWPWQVHLLNSENLRLSFGERIHEAQYVDLIPDVERRSGPLRFNLSCGAWDVQYEAYLDRGVFRYRPVGSQDIVVFRARSTTPLSEWLNEMGMTFILDDDRIIEGDLLYRPTWDRPPFDTSQFHVLDWSKTQLKVESQTSERFPHSIQYRAVQELKNDSHEWEVIVDDDGTGEIADIVAIRTENDTLVVRLVHCKYSQADTAGARVDDLYEVCGQTQKSIAWRRSDLKPFFLKLEERARKKQARENVSPFLAGDLRTLWQIRDQSLSMRRRIEMVLVQPGLSRSAASTPQLDLLASTQAYLQTTINAPLIVWCSE